MSSDERTGAERFMDLAVYAPLGFALEFRRIFPDLADRGRRQVKFTKTLGKTAVTRGGSELRKRLNSEEQPETAAAEPDGEPTAAEELQTARPSEPPSPPRPAPTHLAIADYDSLSAQHVVKRLDGLSPDELEDVRAYEDLNRGRRTILTRVAQLQG